MGPPSSILIAIAIVAQSGEERINPNPESEMSKSRLSIWLRIDTRGLNMSMS
jgi:hypothetical protein